MLLSNAMWANALLGAGVFFAARYFNFDIFSCVMLALNGVFVSLFASTLFRYRRRVGVGMTGERDVQSILSELGVEALHDVYLPTSRGSMQIDHIALFPGSLAIIETKTYSGRLHLDAKNHWHWIGLRGWHRRINNPLWQLEAAQKAIAAVGPNVRVWGLVVLAGNYTTTDAHPEHVVSKEWLRNYIQDHRQRYGEWRYSEKVSEAWKRLNALKEKYGSLRKTHVRNARKKRGDRFYDFEEIWPLWLWGSLAAQAGILCLLAQYGVI
jgi:hypothetical protein